MENARGALGGNAAGGESTFPTPPWTPPQAAPTGTTGILLYALLDEITSRTSTRRCNTYGRQLTDERRYAPMGAPLHRNPRSASPESVIHFGEIRGFDGNGNLKRDPPLLGCRGHRDVAGRSGATGGQVAIRAIAVAPPVACETPVCVWRPCAGSCAGGRQHGRVVNDPVDGRGGGRRVEEDLRPARAGQIGRHHETPALVALADEAEQQVGAGLVERQV